MSCGTVLANRWLSRSDSVCRATWRKSVPLLSYVSITTIRTCDHSPNRYRPAYQYLSEIKNRVSQEYLKDRGCSFRWEHCNLMEKLKARIKRLKAQYIFKVTLLRKIRSNILKTFILKCYTKMKYKPTRGSTKYLVLQTYDLAMVLKSAYEKVLCIKLKKENTGYFGRISSMPDGTLWCFSHIRITIDRWFQRFWVLFWTLTVSPKPYHVMKTDLCRIILIYTSVF